MNKNNSGKKKELKNEEIPLKFIPVDPYPRPTAPPSLTPPRSHRTNGLPQKRDKREKRKEKEIPSTLTMTYMWKT